jgi:uncharacterized membrane protein
MPGKSVQASAGLVGHGGATLMRQIAKMFVFCLAFSSLLFAADYRFVRIDFPNAAATAVGSINARGDVSGKYDDVSGVTHGFLLRKGVFSTIDFPDASFTSARAMNARGDIAGRIHDANGNDHGFLLHDGHFTQINYPGATATVGRGINNAGDITGNHVDSAGNESGFILQDGKFHNVQAPHSFGSICGTDVWMAADNGRLAVGDFCDNRDQSLHGYLRDRAGEFRNIDFPSGGTFPCTSAHYINERGDITGYYGVADTADECFNGTYHGFVLREGKYIAIDFPGADFTVAHAINDDRVIVGFYFDRQGVSHGFKAVPKDDH